MDHHVWLDEPNAQYVGGGTRVTCHLPTIYFSTRPFTTDDCRFSSPCVLYVNNKPSLSTTRLLMRAVLPSCCGRMTRVPLHSWLEAFRCLPPPPPVFAMLLPVTFISSRYVCLVVFSRRPCGVHNGRPPLRERVRPCRTASQISSLL